MRVTEYEQRSPEWYAVRLGIPTASNFARMITPGGKKSAQIEKYINELVGERLTGKTKSIPQTNAMAHGTFMEPFARDYYEFSQDVEVVEVGLCLHDIIDAGASPDGLVGDDGLLEIKCPFEADIHVEYLRAQALPDKYKPQVMGQLWITGREWCDFLSYHDEMKSMLVRVYRDEKYIDALEQIVNEAVQEISNLTEKYRRKDK